MNVCAFKTTKKIFLRPKMSKFDELETQNSKNLHFCALKVTKMENYVEFQSALFNEFVPTVPCVNIEN